MTSRRSSPGSSRRGEQPVVVVLPHNNQSGGVSRPDHQTRGGCRTTVIASPRRRLPVVPQAEPSTGTGRATGGAGGRAVRIGRPVNRPVRGGRHPQQLLPPVGSISARPDRREYRASLCCSKHHLAGLPAPCSAQNVLIWCLAILGPRCVRRVPTDGSGALPIVALRLFIFIARSHLVGWPGGIAPPGSHRSRRDSLPSPGSSHQPLERTDPLPVAEQPGYSCEQPGPPPFEPLVGPQPLVLLPRPAPHVEVDAPQEGIQLRPV